MTGPQKGNVVQLGFSIPFEDDDHKQYAGHNLPLWKDWDGGQVGGRPSWLQPRDLPKNPIICNDCQDPMSFICQLYAPADEINPNAFHRTLYVFGCANAKCAGLNIGSIRVLRGQLPRKNPFYPENLDIPKGEEDNATIDTWAMHLPEAWGVNLCKVCRQRAHGKCPIQGVYFCGKQHQREYKKFVFDKEKKKKEEDSSRKDTNDDDDCFLPSVCSEYELVVEDEPQNGSDGNDNDDGDDDDDDDDDAILERKADKALFGQGKKKNDNDNDDEDRDLEQEDLNEMTGAKGSSSSKDPVTMTFFDRISSKKNVQEQCLRYLRWPDNNNHDDDQRQDGNGRVGGVGAPLWIRQDHQPNSIPTCEYCGAERKFECQLMPQMLHYLLKSHKLHWAEAGKIQNQKQQQKTNEMKEAIEQASSIIEQAPKEQIPPSFAEAKEKAIEKIRTQLLEDQTNELSWGVVGIYTCTASCGEGISEVEGSMLGAYREEFAWKQPSLD